MHGLDLAVRFLLFSRLLQGLQLILGQDQTFLRGLGFGRLEPFLKGFQVVSPPHAADSAWRHKQRLFLQFVGNPHLAKCGFLDGELKDRSLDVVLDPVFHDGPAAAYLLQDQLATGPIEFWEAVEAVA